MIVIYIFEENHRPSETTPNPAPRSIVGAANLAASSRGSRTTFAVCDLIVRTEQEVKMARGLRYLVFDGTNWSGDAVIPNVGMSGSPAAVLWAGGITVFHQGFGDNGSLWYTYSPDGANWGEDTLVQNVGMTASPSAVVY
jgi:hypothetical protein